MKGPSVWRCEDEVPAGNQESVSGPEMTHLVIKVLDHFVADNDVKCRTRRIPGVEVCLAESYVTIPLRSLAHGPRR
jgi:hypothetical protein